jgi:hypothetical protein
MGELTDVHENLVVGLEGKILLGRPRYEWKHHIRMGLKDIVYGVE